MSNNIQAIRGMNDVLPNNVQCWQYVEKVLSKIVTAYGYHEIRLPLLEKTDLFVRTIGEITDIVEKEMYTFLDRNQDSLTLRPEGTASCVRAGIQHGLLYNQIQKLWYMGPMFRHERPQKGRFRQFYQFGVEVFGLAGPDIDAELLLMSARFWKALKISEKVVLHINTIGTKQARALYKKKLVEYFSANSALLDQDSKRRLNTNPLRILDSKNPDLAGLIKNAPKLLDHLDSESQEHFDGLCRILDKAKLPFIIDPCLVRGLDYYGLTVFEWVTTEPGAQNAICAGGHYDELVEELGGKATPALGFAVGLERLIDLVASDQKINYENPPHAYMIMLGDNAVISGVLLAEKLRNLLPNLQIIVNCGDGNLTNQLKKADKSGALFALILGEEEMRNEEITIKNLRTTNTKKFEQMRVKINELENFFTSLE